MVGSFVHHLIVGMVVAVGLGVAMPEASAQSGQVPPSARDVLTLITEHSSSADGDDAGAQNASVHYWWSAAGAPDWSESDQKIHELLERHRIQLLKPEGQTGISKIYRRADLSLANAATLGSLLSARRVLVGHIEYTHQRPLGMVGLERVSAYADISLVSAETGQNAALQRFTVRRDAFAPTADEALNTARGELTEAFAELAAAALLRGAGPVGVHSEETLIGLHNAQNAQTLQRVTQFLEELDAVDRVQIRWVAEGMIALEINPGKRDEATNIEYAIRALANQPFDEFRLSQRPSDSAEGLVEFDILREGGAF